MKTKRINLFISCSTKSDVLTKQKKEITDLCNVLNIEYAKSNGNISIKAVGYDDPERRKKVFERFIRSNADIVLFLVDKDNSEKQKAVLFRELKKACSSHKENRCPEILVYMPDDVELSTKEEIQDILKKNGLSINTLKDDTSLVNNVEDNIRRYVNSYNILRDIHIWTIIKRYSVVAAIILLGGTIIFFSLYCTEKQKRLLIAGGGSAKELIECKYGRGILDDKYWIYAPIPSGSAYRLLTEETKMDIKKGEYNNRDYYTVILSADKAEQSDFLKDNSFSDFKKTGIVVGIHIGFDTLAIYHPKRVVIDTNNIKEYIKSILRDTNKNIHIYTTNEKSGTLNAYNKYLDTTIIPPSDSAVFYSKKTIDDNRWIALGSKYYGPENKDIDTFLVRGERKQVYIYFMKYKNTGSKSYELPSATEKFLEKLGIPEDAIKSVKETQKPLESNTGIIFDNYCVVENCDCHKKK